VRYLRAAVVVLLLSALVTACNDDCQSMGYTPLSISAPLRGGGGGGGGGGHGGDGGDGGEGGGSHSADDDAPAGGGSRSGGSSYPWYHFWGDGNDCKANQ
jgi:hypothetical protein